MKQYCCYVLDQEGRVHTREILEGSHDNEVFGSAKGYLAQHPLVPTVEIWLENRYVGKVHQPIAAMSLDPSRIRGDAA